MNKRHKKKRLKKQLEQILPKLTVGDALLIAGNSILILRVSTFGFDDLESVPLQVFINGDLRETARIHYMG